MRPAPPGLAWWSGFCALAGLGACIWAAWGLACTPAQVAQVQQDAVLAAPLVAGECALAPDTGPAAPYLELLCAGATAADSALSRLPPGTAAIVAVSPPVPAAPAALPGTAPRLTTYRLRVLLHSFPPPRPSATIPATAADLLQRDGIRLDAGG